MKNFLFTIALAASSFVQAQSINFTVINGVYTDRCFFDVLSINTSTGEVTTHQLHKQGFYGVAAFNNLKVNDGDILIVQSRTHPDRKLIGDFSARVNLNSENKLEVIESTESFSVSDKLTYDQAITREE